jgi:hypothetical protein
MLLTNGIALNHVGTNESPSTMPRTLRVNDPNGEPIGTADSEEGIKHEIEGLGPGGYHVDEISSDPLPSGHTSRRWGVGIKRPNGSVSLDLDPWPMAT